MIFTDRQQAGQVLGSKLSTLVLGKQPTTVLALPRGGVPVGYEVARALSAPFDVFTVRKIGVPGHEELAMGAIASGGVIVVNQSVVRMLGVSQAMFDAVAQREAVELERRERLYRGNKQPAELSGRTCIIVDDGIATGASMQAAALALRKRNPQRIIVAAPVASPSVYQQFEGVADAVVCLQTPAEFVSVGSYYESFSQTTDEEVRYYLEQANQAQMPKYRHCDQPPLFS